MPPECHSHLTVPGPRDLASAGRSWAVLETPHRPDAAYLPPPLGPPHAALLPRPPGGARRQRPGHGPDRLQRPQRPEPPGDRLAGGRDGALRDRLPKAPGGHRGRGRRRRRGVARRARPEPEPDRLDGAHLRRPDPDLPLRRGRDRQRDRVARRAERVHQHLGPRERLRRGVDGRREVAPESDRPRAGPHRPLPRRGLRAGSALVVLRRPTPELLDRGPRPVRDRAVGRPARRPLAPHGDLRGPDELHRREPRQRPPPLRRRQQPGALPRRDNRRLDDR